MLVSALHFFFIAFAFFPEFKEYGKVLNGTFSVVKKFDPIFVQLNVLEDISSPLVIIPETW
jgi:hypothetical protein